MKAKVIPINQAPSAAKKRAIVDRLGFLTEQAREFEPVLREIETLRKQVSSWHERDAADAAFTEEGDKYLCEISARSNERTITSMPKLHKRLGIRAFLANCRFPLSALDHLIPPSEQLDLVKVEATGSRKVRVFAKYLGEKAA